MLTSSLTQAVRPTILYDTGHIAREVDALRRGLAQARPQRQANVLYHSLKANNFEDVLGYVRDLGLGASVSNLSELAMARNLGFQRICATSPAFSTDEIRYLSDCGVETYLSSPSQIAAAPEGGSIGIRVVACDASGRVTSRFGVNPWDPETAAEISRRNLRITAALFHNRDIGRAKQLIDHVQHAVRFAERHPTVRSLNLGGGMTALRNNVPAWETAWREAATYLRKLPQHVTLSLEPGAQHLSANGYLLCQVRDVRVRAPHRQEIVINASHWCLQGWSRFEILAPSGPCRTTIYGPTCFEEDNWCTDVKLACLKAGSFIAFKNAGAYITSMARRFCLEELPRERLFRSHGEVTLADLQSAASRVPEALQGSG